MERFEQSISDEDLDAENFPDSVWLVIAEDIPNATNSADQLHFPFKVNLVA
jgi:flagellar biosynthesis regulator FlaF